MSYHRTSADPDDTSALIDLICVPWRRISEKPTAAPNEAVIDCARSISV
jgi:hypothetical protein